MRRLNRLGIEDLESRILLHGNPASGILEPDVNGDGRVDVFDVNLVSARWGTSGPVGDANGDGAVDVFDIDLISAHFSESLPHSDDAVKQLEHLDLLALVNRDDATAVAHESGPWSDPDIWVEGRVPSAGDKVLIPRGVHVTVDGVYSDQIAWIRVDGTLEFAADRDTQLTVDTLIGSATSMLLIDTPRPYTTRIVVADRGPIDTTWDPLALSRGLIWHGAATIHGAEMAPYALATGDLAAGQQQFSVNDAHGWRVGDQLRVEGTTPSPSDSLVDLDGLNQDEDVGIASIVGNVITLDRPLNFNHVTVNGNPPMVENLTRNVVVTSENAADISRRGHVMFMHNPNVEISGAAFSDLGRTRKDIPVTDPDGSGLGLENTRGRYALHFHRTGFDSVVSVSGVVVTDATSWGIVIHESWVDLSDFTVDGAFGAAVMVETGNEIGTIAGGVIRNVGGAPRSGQAAQDHAEVFGLLVPPGNNDLGFAGHGIWTNSRKVVIEDNNVENTAAEAYFINAAAPFDSEPFIFRQNTADNEAGGSLTIWSGPQFVGLDTATQSLVEGNVLRGPVVLGYTGHIDFVDNQILGPEIAPTNSYGPYTTGVGHTGVNFDMRWINNTITGWWTGLTLGTEGTHVVQGGAYDNLGTNLLVHNTQQNRARSIAMDGAVFGDRARYNVEMSPGFFSYDFEPAYKSHPWQYVPPPPLFRLFTQSSLGSNSIVTLDGDRLHFDVQGNDFSWDQLRYQQFASTTTAELWNDYRLAVGNILVPDDAYQLPGVRGWLSPSAPIVLSDLTLLGPRAIPRLAGYVAHVRDSSGNDVYSEPTNLVGGLWNVVTVNVDGYQRGMLVFALDANSIATHWGTPAIEGDANGDGMVNIFDVNALSSG